MSRLGVWLDSSDFAVLENIPAVIALFNVALTLTSSDKRGHNEATLFKYPDFGSLNTSENTRAEVNDSAGHVVEENMDTVERADAETPVHTDKVLGQEPSCLG